MYYGIEHFEDLYLWIEMLEFELKDERKLNKNMVKEISNKLSRLGQERAQFLLFFTKFNDPERVTA